MKSKVDPVAAGLAERMFASLLPTDAARALFVVLLRELAAGKPVPVSALVEAVGWSVERVAETLEQVSSIERDEAGNVVGAGLTLRATAHAFEVGGRRVYTWCALDSLVFPTLLGRPAYVSSRCAASGAPIHLTVAPGAVSEVEPPEAVVSLVAPERCSDVRSTFCSHSNFFASATVAQSWLHKNPGSAVTPVAEASQIGRDLARRLSG